MTYDETRVCAAAATTVHLCAFFLLRDPLALMERISICLFLETELLTTLGRFHEFRAYVAHFWRTKVRCNPCKHKILKTWQGDSEVYM